jgi:hypothetical protein
MSIEIPSDDMPTLDAKHLEPDMTIADFQEHCDAVDAAVTRVGDVSIAYCSYLGLDNVLFAEYDHANERVYLYLI